MDIRIKVILSFVIAVLLGVPVWWKTTEVYRATLPHEGIATWNQTALKNSDWNIHIDVIVLTDAKQSDEGKILKDNLEKNKELFKTVSSTYYTTNFEIKVDLRSVSSLEQTLSKLNDDDLDNYLQKQTSTNVNGRFTFFVIPGTINAKSLFVTLGKYRHGWIRVPSDKKLGDVDGKQLMSRLVKASTRYLISTSGNTDEITAVRPATQYRLSFTLLNADPVSYRPSWEITKVTEKYLAPFLEAVSPIANFTIDSQILHYASLLKEPQYDAAKSIYYIPSHILPQYINPAEWKLDFTDNSTQPLLNFILYIPAAGQVPLHIKQSDGTILPTNAFISPQWGGIYIYNPPASTNKGKDKNVVLTVKDLHPAMEVFVGQLRTLLGVDVPLSPSNDVLIPNKETGIAQWEADTLTRRYAFYNLNSTISTLKSLSYLVQNLTNMVVKDNIADLCLKSLDALHKSNEALKNEDYDNVLKYSKVAMDNAEEAFFDPNMLSMLYFPDEHKYAIYALPFFPLLFQLATGVWGEFKAQRSKKLKRN